MTPAKGVKPGAYYNDQHGSHPVFALADIVAPGDVVAEIGADEIKDSHIDWGTGAGQVSAGDIPSADAGGRYTAEDTDGQLQELAGAGRTTQTVKANADAIAAAMPPGTILMYGGSSAPSGFLLCDGSAVSETTYAALFAVIGHSFGGDPGGGNFYVPNLKGISPTGVGAQDINGRTKTGPALGEVREDQFQGHNCAPNADATRFRTYDATLTSGSLGIWRDGTGTTIPLTLITDGTNGTPRTGAYTHGPEVGLNFIIKT